MHCKFKFVLLILLAMSGASLFSTPALAGVDDALREVGRSVRREVRDRRRDRVREAICEDADGDFRRACRTVDRVDEVGDRIRRRRNRERVLDELFD